MRKDNKDDQELLTWTEQEVIGRVETGFDTHEDILCGYLTIPTGDYMPSELYINGMTYKLDLSTARLN